MKKILSILLAVLMLTSTASFSAFADEAQPIAKVTEYLNAPGQYTNHSAYGINIDGTLNGKLCSLGNFGGYVVYEFNEPVLNSDNHAYGVDFMIYGNAFNGNLTTQEPGQVWVSQDGEKWYALAGSEHYENETEWNYTLNYQKFEERKTKFTDCLDDSGIISPAPFPIAANYPLVAIPEEELSLNGILLRKQTTASTANGITTSFGYVDALAKSTGSTPFNPYCENPVKNGKDGQFDISWAVDENGYGVSLDWIKYVKVQTATFINGGAFGEKSTEISGLAIADSTEKPVTKTPAPKSISINDTEINLADDKDYYEVNVDGEFDVAVDTDANVYINNSYGTSTHFYNTTDKGIIRIIVQADDCSPVIYYIKTNTTKPKTEIILSETEKEITLGKSSKVTATTNNGENITWSSDDENIACINSDGTIITKSIGETYITATAESGVYKKCKVTVTVPAPSTEVTITFSISGGENQISKHTVTVSSDINEKYGYPTADKDHNGIKVQGVTVFDVILAVHEELYGNEFNEETKENYLVMNSSFITKAFSQNAGYSGFLVNGVMPNDGIINPDYNSFTGYSCDTARVNDDDDITFFFYQDRSFYSDYYAWFNENEYTASENETVTVNINGYCAMYYGINQWQTIFDKYATPLEGISIFTDINGEKVLIGTTDENGNAEITFGKAGSYQIYAQGSFIDEYDEECPIITAYADVTVNADTQPVEPEQPSERTFCEWVVYILSVVKDWFIKAYNFLFGWIYK